MFWIPKNKEITEKNTDFKLLENNILNAYDTIIENESRKTTTDYLLHSLNSSNV
jgi:hypothetical protein